MTELSKWPVMSREWRPAGVEPACALPVDADEGALWRCDYRHLHRRAPVCDLCDQFGGDGCISPHDGEQLVWRPGRLRQRLRHLHRRRFGWIAR